MGPSLSTIRLRMMLVAAAVLSALSAAEATLGAAPLFDVGGDRDWPAQMTAGKDRDSASPRAARAAGHEEDAKAPHHHGGGGGPACVGDVFPPFDSGVVASIPAPAHDVAPICLLVHALIDLPPPRR